MVGLSLKGVVFYTLRLICLDVQSTYAKVADYGLATFSINGTFCSEIMNHSYLHLSLSLPPYTCRDTALILAQGNFQWTLWARFVAIVPQGYSKVQICLI
jgi:hypothetical protein